MRSRDIEKQLLVKQKAIGLMVQVGFEGFSMNKLAKACGISVGTLYIYYKDKDDLIIQIAEEEARRMSSMMLENFDPEAGFAEGLKQQWKNRSKHMMENQQTAHFFEQLRSSTYQSVIYESFFEEFKVKMGRFMKNAIKRGEIHPMPLEVYWSVAFAPLYNLVRFHNEGRSIGGASFVLTQDMIWQTFDLVLKALKK
ncbi:TetR/AcrR family transcriptional regulator [Mucilaginibacter sp. UR6-1]|uniref:TetR/AcrR family transcriptional regulator n=1 Tax=Mucilaginibacter sp. UR6-1 TaxID=1435643 RepID=UPI001E2A8E28|nr:TetR/AcrR family transcriptional regulator [Mucilaginibacter sp. UR6-1]MCC8411133.1 TetR/AcrR family transcriptional regulator [Mucilaginibacter sp. UR6-1]